MRKTSSAQDIGGSKYKYVREVLIRGRRKWYARVQKFGYGVVRNTEREAALCVDMCLINNGKEPLNILVRKE